MTTYADKLMARSRRMNQRARDKGAYNQGSVGTSEEVSMLKETSRHFTHGVARGALMMPALPMAGGAGLAELGMRIFDTEGEDERDRLLENMDPATRKRVMAAIGQAKAKSELMNQGHSEKEAARMASAVDGSVSEMRGESLSEPMKPDAGSWLQPAAQAAAGTLQAVGINPETSPEVLNQMSSDQLRTLAAAGTIGEIAGGAPIIPGAGLFLNAGKAAITGKAGVQAIKAANKTSTLGKVTQTAALPVAGAVAGPMVVEGSNAAPEQQLEDYRMASAVGSLVGGMTPFAASGALDATRWTGKMAGKAWQTVTPGGIAYKKLKKEGGTRALFDEPMQNFFNKTRRDLDTAGLTKEEGHHAAVFSTLGNETEAVRARRLMRDKAAHDPDLERQTVDSIDATRRAVKDKVEEQQSRFDESAYQAEAVLDDLALRATRGPAPGEFRQEHLQAFNSRLRDQKLKHKARLSKRYDQLRASGEGKKFRMWETEEPIEEFVDKEGKVHQQLTAEMEQEVADFFGKHPDKFRVMQLEDSALNRLMGKVLNVIFENKQFYDNKMAMDLMAKMNQIQRYNRRLDPHIQDGINEVKGRLYQTLSEVMDPADFKKFRALQSDYKQYISDYGYNEVVKNAVGQANSTIEEQARLLAETLVSNKNINTGNYTWMTRALGGDDEATEMVNNLITKEFRQSLGNTVTPAEHTRLLRKLRADLQNRREESPGFAALQKPIMDMLDERLYTNLMMTPVDKLRSTITGMNKRQYQALLRGKELVDSNLNAGIPNATSQTEPLLGHRMISSLYNENPNDRVRLLSKMRERIEDLGVKREDMDLLEALANLDRTAEGSHFIPANPQGTGVPGFLQGMLEQSLSTTGTQVKTQAAAIRSWLFKFQAASTAFAGTFFPNWVHNKVGKQVLRHMLDQAMEQPVKTGEFRKWIDEALQGNPENFNKWAYSVAPTLEQMGQPHKEGNQEGQMNFLGRTIR